MWFGIFLMTVAFAGMFLWGMGWRISAKMYRRLYERGELLNAAIRVQDNHPTEQTSKSTLKEPDSKSRNTSKSGDSMKGTE